MAVIRRLKALDLVFDEIVANLGKYKKTVSHSVFFFLAREGTPISATTPVERAKKCFSLAVAGFRRFGEYVTVQRCDRFSEYWYVRSCDRVPECRLSASDGWFGLLR
eukprot:m.226158 g.226158  ORF g.226158 m.226158 type:complete len:107 (+) comp40024_c0_seq34:145-465(+)